MKSYYDSDQIEFKKNCYSDFLNLLENLNDIEDSDKYYYDMLELALLNKDISKYSLANKIINESKINLFSILFVENHSFIDLIKEYSIFKESIVRSLSNHIISLKQKDLNSFKNKMIYLSNFRKHPKSIRKFLNSELNLAIIDKKINKIDLIGQVIDITDWLNKNQSE